jgi:hypothetical protein
MARSLQFFLWASQALPLTPKLPPAVRGALVQRSLRQAFGCDRPFYFFAIIFPFLYRFFSVQIRGDDYNAPEIRIMLQIELIMKDAVYIIFTLFDLPVHGRKTVHGRWVTIHFQPDKGF